MGDLAGILFLESQIFTENQGEANILVVVFTYP